MEARDDVFDRGRRAAVGRQWHMRMARSLKGYCSAVQCAAFWAVDRIDRGAGARREMGGDAGNGEMEKREQRGGGPLSKAGTPRDA